MKIWLTSIITASLILSLLSSLIPDGAIKKAALTAFGFVFLTISVSPIISIINKGLSLDVLMLESITETGNESNDNYISEVIKNYKDSIVKECVNILKENSVNAEIIIEVNEDYNSEDFCSITWVKCIYYPEEEKELQHKNIEKIVIDFDGISLNEPETKDTSSEKNKIVKVISGFLGIEKERVYVELG